MRRKVPGRNPLLKPKVFSQSAQIQRPTVPSQKLQIKSTQRVNHPTSVERKDILQPLIYTPRVQPRSEVKSREVTKQDRHCSPQQTSQIYHPPKLLTFSERQMFDSSQTVIHQHDINNP